MFNLTNKILYTIMLISYVFNGCKISERNNNNFEKSAVVEEPEIIKLTHSTWDGQSSVILSFNNEFIREAMSKPSDYIFADTLTISRAAMHFIGNFIERNKGDSAKGSLDAKQSFLEVILKSNSQNLDFYTQPKSDNKFLLRFLDTIEKSPYEKECARLILILKKFNKVNSQYKN